MVDNYHYHYCQVVDSEPRMGAEFCFNIYDGKRALMVAASSQTEKSQWMEDITETVQVDTSALHCTDDSY